MNQNSTGRKKHHSGRRGGKRYVSLSGLKDRYGFSEEFILSHFPDPVIRASSRRPNAIQQPAWTLDTVRNTLLRTSVKKELDRIKNSARSKRRRAEDLKRLLLSYTPDSMIEQGSFLPRRFVLHSGPTNSGKTHDALEALKNAVTGVYLGPLRLLALEMFDRINGEGIPCNLLTGEEQQNVEGALITASTIELCDYTKWYDVAVIDEAQMISDPDRGSHWLKALCLVQAKEVHVCCAPEAESLMTELIESLGAPYETVRHERLVPLVFSGKCNGLQDVQDGDAVIAFSRKNVLNIAGLLEQHHKNASVIYGALPPEARREEVRRYTSGETTVVVATDAIGMGISLPIRRIVFADTSKFDGKERRPLRPVEIKQISGRAGRYGMFDLGEVLAMNNVRSIRRGFEEDVPDLSALRIPFPRELLETDYTLSELLSGWKNLPPVEAFDREDVRDAEFLLQVLGSEQEKAPKSFIYDLITCPVNIKSDLLVHYWLSCCKAILSDRPLPMPPFGSATLEKCELQYSAFDIHHQLMRRIGVEEDCEKQKSYLCDKINAFLKAGKSTFIKRCRVCGKILPIGSRYNVCDACFQEGYEYGRYYR